MSTIRESLYARILKVQNDATVVAQQAHGLAIDRQSDDGRMLAGAASALETAAQQLRLVLKD